MWHIIPDSFRTHWKDWEVRFLVLCSLLLQMVLIPTGTRRKATQRIYIQFLVWSAYLTAESVPILTLGVISNWLSNLKNQTTTGVLERKYELMALWAPFLLVHLGGPDSITAYALEDNELWLRHLVKVSVQIGWTFYIYFLALSSSPLSYLAFAVIVIGALKNFERSLSLFRASKDEFRDSFTSPPRSSLLYPRLTGNLSLKMKEGHIVTLDSITEIQAPEALSLPKYRHLEKPQDRNVYIAHQLLKTFEVLFADLIVNLKSLEIIKSVIMEVTSENAFKIIDIELNLMFEFLYTKARIIYRPFGIISKTITMVLTLGVVLSFCMVDKQVYELKLDVSITFMVILGLLLSEIYSIIKVISSDRLYALFIERKSSFLYRLVSYMQSCQELGWLGFATEGCRWSATLSQFNILCFAVDKTWKMFSYNKKIEKLYEKIKQYFSIFYQPLGDGMRIWIHMYLKGKVEKLGEEGHLNATNKKPWLPAYGATKILYELSLDQLTWSTDEIEFSRSIVIWHIATEIQYYVGRKLFGEKDDILTNCEISRTLSNYLIYLLVRESNMLPIGVGDNYYAHTLLEARKFFEDQSSKIPSPNSKKFGERIGLRKNYEHEEREPFCCCHQQEKVHKNREEKSKSQEAPKIRKHESQGDLDTCRICHMLLQVPHESEMEPKLVEGGGNQSLLFHAVHLAQQLNEIGIEKRWEVIRDVWTEALLYSAYHSSGEVHAKQLSYGGEFLTHVWLVMAHFGVSKQIKTSTKTALKRMVQI